jgi:murein DD-endopeptidase MepM/ murein hydrolase activator NlpD
MEHNSRDKPALRGSSVSAELRGSPLRAEQVRAAPGNPALIRQSRSTAKRFANEAQASPDAALQPIQNSDNKAGNTLLGVHTQSGSMVTAVETMGEAVTDVEPTDAAVQYDNPAAQPLPTNATIPAQRQSAARQPQRYVDRTAAGSPRLNRTDKRPTTDSAVRTNAKQDIFARDSKLTIPDSNSAQLPLPPTNKSALRQRQNSLMPPYNAGDGAAAQSTDKAGTDSALTFRDNNLTTADVPATPTAPIQRQSGNRQSQRYVDRTANSTFRQNSTERFANKVRSDFGLKYAAPTGGKPSAQPQSADTALTNSRAITSAHDNAAPLADIRAGQLPPTVAQAAVRRLNAAVPQHSAANRAKSAVRNPAQTADKQPEPVNAAPTAARPNNAPAVDRTTARQSKSNAGQKPPGKLNTDTKLNADTKTQTTHSNLAGKTVTLAAAQIRGAIDNEAANADNSAVDAVRYGERSVEKALKFGKQQYSRRAQPSGSKLSNRQQSGGLNFKSKNAPGSRKTPKNSQKSSKAAQKYGNKRQYAAALRKSKTAGKTANKAANAAGEKVRQAAAQLVKSHPGAAAAVVITLILLLILVSVVAPFSGVFSGAAPAIAGTYLTDEVTLTGADVMYSSWETDLKLSAMSIDGIIRHNPVQLAAYLTAKFGAFTSAQAEAELAVIFTEQYAVNEYGNVTAQTFESVIIAKMTASELAVYNMLLLTGGNRQIVGSPFDFNWVPYITSNYGYRLSPFTGVKTMHRGLDIGLPEGTPILAANSGAVTVGWQEGGYGNYVVITDADGVVTKYGHCHTVLVTSGQYVTAGEVIATVGTTGASTGNHLHFELLLNGEYLSPIFFTANKPQEAL